MDKVIITAALTGGGTIPTQSPYIPITPEEIALEAKRAARRRGGHSAYPSP